MNAKWGREGRVGGILFEAYDIEGLREGRWGRAGVGMVVAEMGRQRQKWQIKRKNVTMPKMQYNGKGMCGSGKVQARSVPKTKKVGREVGRHRCPTYHKQQNTWKQACRWWRRGEGRGRKEGGEGENGEWGRKVRRE